MNNFSELLDGFFLDKLFYQDTDSLYIHLDCYQKLKDAGYVENKLRQGKNRGDGGILYGLLHAVKKKKVSQKTKTDHSIKKKPLKVTTILKDYLQPINIPY